MTCYGLRLFYTTEAYLPWPGIAKLLSEPLVVFLGRSDLRIDGNRQWDCTIEETYEGVARKSLENEDGDGRQRGGVKHVTNPDNHYHGCLSMYGKRNRPPLTTTTTPAKSIIIHLQNFWNYWFHQLSVNMDPQTPWDLKPNFYRSPFINKCLY